MTGTNSSGIEAALKLAKMADVIVLALGIDKTVEHEGIDRQSIELPGLQASFAKAVFALGKPTVLVLTNGGPLAIDDLIDGKKTAGFLSHLHIKCIFLPRQARDKHRENSKKTRSVEGADAIVEAFNPAFGARQLAEALFGVTNSW